MRLLLTLWLCLLALPLAAQERKASHCIALVQNTPGFAMIQPAAFGGALPDYTVRLSYVHHATFVLETPGGLTAATDFTGYLGPTTLTPDVVTMNNAHTTHFTDLPDPAIPHVLRGWNPAGGAAAHYLDLGEMLVRNVPTDVRSYDGTDRRRDGNSIFVFEVGGLCIGHLGHLHHEPSAEQYAALGRLDVVMAPVDGGYTVPLPVMIRVLERLRSSVVIPMHWFGSASLERFIEGMSGSFAIERPGAAHYEVSLRSLPSRPTVVVLRPRPLEDPSL